MLGSYAGATFAVAVLTQITKEIPGLRRIPTQIWSYFLSLATLILSQVFGDGVAASGAVLSVFNAALVSLAANGGYAMVERLKAGLGA
ncbi:MAG: hypothetical protein IJ466_03900 [Clostridia bacterium]|nr:hypothetical protein [Clostridia bacterium]